MRPIRIAADAHGTVTIRTDHGRRPAPTMVKGSFLKSCAFPAPPLAGYAAVFRRHQTVQTNIASRDSILV